MTLAAAFSAQLVQGRVGDGRSREKIAAIQREEKYAFEELCLVLLLLCGIPV